MKSILVHVDASPRSAVRLELALALAQAHSAELTAFYGVMPAMLAMPWAAEPVNPSFGSLADETDRRQHERARAAFERLGGADKARWVAAAEQDGGRLPWHLARRALTSDLLVLGQYDADDREAGALPPDLVPAAIVDSGKPTLVVPSAGDFDAAPRSVLLAWKPTREAARAAAATLPWLTRAREIHIAAGEEAGEPVSFDDIAHWMQLHGVAGKIERHGLGDINPGEALLSLAADVDAGLLAMGCYGHSRAREWVLGGVTRTILRSMTVPTLMAH